VVHDVDVRRDALFDTSDRTDATPLRPGESRFEFLNRSASIFVRPIRELLQEWLDHVPADARRDLVGALQGDNRQHESAFWELYLHEGFRCSGYEIEIHPEIPGITTGPDFRMSDGTTRFYLETVAEASGIYIERVRGAESARPPVELTGNEWLRLAVSLDGQTYDEFWRAHSGRVGVGMYARGHMLEGARALMKELSSEDPGNGDT
jgi:hypothetical protein